MDPAPLLALGGDFVPAYSAGKLVREGRASDIYNLDAMAAVERGVVADGRLEPLRLYGPYLNPPWFAAAYAPLSALPYRIAAGVWLAINLLCVAVSMVLLRRMLPEGVDWRTWGLVPLLVLISMPFWQAVCHLQNTCVSLLLVGSAVTCWRGWGGNGGKWLAGVCCGLLFYKPQLACVLAGVMCISLGWRAAVACAATVAVLITATLVALPGTISSYLHHLPQSVAMIQNSPIYNWGRQVTPRGFWRLLIQGHSGGAEQQIVTLLTFFVMLCAGALLATATWRWVKGEQNRAATDRLIAATVAAMPLLMPYYMDYDLSLLAVPAVLIAHEYIVSGTMSRFRRSVVWAWGVMFIALYINPGLSGATRVNLAAPLVAIVGVTAMIRCWKGSQQAMIEEQDTRVPLARAA
jgi:hypothetical protein